MTILERIEQPQRRAWATLDADLPVGSLGSIGGSTYYGYDEFIPVFTTVEVLAVTVFCTGNASFLIDCRQFTGWVVNLCCVDLRWTRLSTVKLASYVFDRAEID